MGRTTLHLLTTLSLTPLVLSSCSLSSLQSASASLTTFLKTGDITTFPNLSPSLLYLENDKPLNITSQSIASPSGLKISASRAYHDTTLCKSITEHVVADAGLPMIVNTQSYLSSTTGEVEKLDTIILTPGDFGFANVTDAENYIKFAYAQNEAWTLIPEEKRDSREVIQAAGDDYFEHLHDRAPFPAYVPCWIVGGGSWQGEKDPSKDSCTHAPRNESNPIQTMKERRYVIDEAHGVMSIFTAFEGLDKKYPNSTYPDNHTFRIEGGRVRYVHVAAVCESNGCSW